ncbi:MAG: hypothetical protein LC772_05620 [Chloroflexi bacterium]|nr:hypothetical protein [Chloroflexota bacterium]
MNSSLAHRRPVYKYRSARILFSLAGFAFLFSAVPAVAEHFDINLTLRGTHDTASARWDTSPLEGGVNPRQTLHAAVGEDLTLDWGIASDYPHGTMKAVRVRIFAAPEDRIGQKREPAPTAVRLFDNTFTADFLPDHRAVGRIHFRVHHAGNYLVRLQSENTAAEHGHEHFAAIDLKVK